MPYIESQLNITQNKLNTGISSPCDSIMAAGVWLFLLEIASKVYDTKARELFGEFACLNFKEVI